MAAPTTEFRVQDANVESAGDGFWICSRQIVSDITLSETLPMENNVQVINFEGLRFSRSENVDIIPAGSGDVVIWLSAS